MFSRRWKLSRPEIVQHSPADLILPGIGRPNLSRKLKPDQKARNLGDGRRITRNRIER